MLDVHRSHSHCTIIRAVNAAIVIALSATIDKLKCSFERSATPRDSPTSDHFSVSISIEITSTNFECATVDN